MAWTERWPRPSHDLVFTPLGGRRRSDELAGLPDATIGIATRYLSQVAIALPHTDPRQSDPDVDYWVTVCRKILQRGSRPPLSPRVEQLLPGPAASLAPQALLGALIAGVEVADTDAAYELHPRWERPFWDRARTLAPHAAAWLIPQAPLEALIAGELDPGVGRRWVDFLYAPPGQRPVIFEIDGFDHLRRADADRARDRQLGEVGIVVVRADGIECLDPAAPMLTRLLVDDHRFAADRGDPDGLATTILPHRFALGVVEAVERGLLPKGGPWSIDAVDPDGLVDVLVGPALDPLRAVSELWRLDVVPRAVQVNGRLLRLKGEAGTKEPAPPRLEPTVRIRIEPRTPYWAPLSAAGDIPEITIRPAGVPADLAWLPSRTADRRLMRSSADTDLHLHLLVEDLFGHTAFREGQLPALRQVLRGGDSVVLLPTGAGKSLIYQLAGLLMPGTTIVVDPLTSLIDDQEAHLLHDGIDRVTAIHASRTGGTRERDLALEAVARGEPLFLFVTPERFQNQRFRDNLRESARRQLINLAVIDEAHTVSEWGHDFKPSYLRLARNIRRLCCDNHGVWPPLLALTGTAGPAVLRDVLRELEIDADADGALQRPASHDRPNLHFLKLTGDDPGWLDLVRRAMTEVVPQALGVDPSAMADLQGPATLSGLVFCPWARSEHGVDRVRDEIVRSYAQASVALRAETYAGRSSSDGGQAGWAEHRANAAADFKANRVPLLVTTKAFGMGIDKPNIRYTVHAGFPSSIEAFAQEAGRAGRDGQDAFCVLTAALPDEAVAAQLLDRSIGVVERRRRAERTRRDQSGDLGRQLFFYGNSFPGAEEEADLGIKLYRWLIDRGGGPGKQAVIAVHPRRNEKSQDHDRRKGRYDRVLFRLASLGVVDDLTKNGDEFTVQLAVYDSATIDTALLAYLGRIEPGNEATHRALVDEAPELFEDRLAAHLKTLADATYRIVAAARLTAIENMYDLARGADDPEHLRNVINSYLGGGPAAGILAEGIAMSPIDVPRFVAALEALQAADLEGLTGAVARQREAYPDHPLLWLTSAFVTAREPDGIEAQFVASVAGSLERFANYAVPPEQAAAGMRSLMHNLRSEHNGRRWDWSALVFEAWDRVGLGIHYLEDAEDEVLDLAGQGRYRERELSAVIRRRFRRRAGAVTALAGQYAGTSPVDQGGPE